MKLIIWLLVIIGVFILSIFTGMVRDEVRGQLDRVPYALLRLARRRVPRELRVCLHDEEWLPELHYIINRDEALPISRLLMGTLFALGILRTARRISRDRVGSAAREIELRRLISLNIVMIAGSNIIVAAIGYSMAFVVSFTVSVAFITVIGLVNSLVWLPVEVILAVIFGPTLGIFFASVISRGLVATFRRLIIPAPIGWASLTRAPSFSVRAVSAFSDFFAVRGKVSLSAIVAGVSCLAGVTLGLFAGIGFGRVIGTMLMTMGVVAAVAVVRLAVVAPLERLYRRRYARIDKSAKTE
jgi:hypothetical protein